MSAADAELPGSVEGVRAAFDQSAHLLFAVEGPEFRIASYNQALVGLFGARALGTSVRDAFPEGESQRVWDQYEEVYRTGVPKQMHEWRFQFLGEDGEPVEVFVDFTVAPWRDQGGEIVGLIGAANDVTALVEARRRAEEQQAASEGRYRAAQGLVTAMQDALLPHELPVVPGVDVAARYLLAAEDAAGGGDWFDAVVRPNDRVAVVVGDVVGHGVVASAVMGQLRAVLHERLLSESSMLDAVAGLDRFAATLPDAHAATVCVAELDPRTGVLDYCTAGHPPPLVVAPNGEARFVPTTGSGPLATGTTLRSATTTVAADELVLLYSDGLVERPGRTVAQNTVELLQVAGDTYSNRGLVKGAPSRATERVCQLSIELLTRISGYSDDITVLAVQTVPPITTLETVVAADVHAVTAVRAELGEWLTALEVRSLDELALQHAVGELVANVVEHAYSRREPSRALVRAELGADGRVTVIVTDTGRWHDVASPDAEHGGRGLAMARGLVDHLQIQRGDTGTTVTIRHRLSRPAQLLTPREAAIQGPGGDWSWTSFEAEVDEGTGAVRVRGPVDIATAPRLRTVLFQVGRGGARPLVVDLDGVTILASAGVQVLHEVRDLHVSSGGHLDLRANPGSPAHHVLDLVGLPHRARRGGSAENGHS